MFKRLLLLAFFLVSLTAGAQQEKPPWLILELGREALTQNRPGEALLYFQDLAKEGLYPCETAFYIGRIYEIEAETALALRQYAKALSWAKQAYVPEFKYQILYQTAALHFKIGNQREYEESLLLILQDDELYFKPENLSTQQSYLRAVEEGGLDKLLLLYRQYPSFSLLAHQKLAEYYYKEGRYSRSLLHSSFSLISLLSPMLDRLKQRDPDFRFSSVFQAFEEATREVEEREFLKDAGFYGSLYYYGTALYAMKDYENAKEGWKLLYLNKDSEVWGRMADRQLKLLE